MQITITISDVKQLPCRCENKMRAVFLNCIRQTTDLPLDSIPLNRHSVGLVLLILVLPV